jgi:hypothetical protein
VDGSNVAGQDVRDFARQQVEPFELDALRSVRPPQ